MAKSTSDGEFLIMTVHSIILIQHLVLPLVQPSTALGTGLGTGFMMPCVRIALKRFKLASTRIHHPFGSRPGSFREARTRQTRTRSKQRSLPRLSSLSRCPPDCSRTSVLHMNMRRTYLLAPIAFSPFSDPFSPHFL